MPKARVSRDDKEGREITAATAMPYDTLVMAIGNVSNDFGTPGVPKYVGDP